FGFLLLYTQISGPLQEFMIRGSQRIIVVDQPFGRNLPSILLREGVHQRNASPSCSRWLIDIRFLPSLKGITMIYTVRWTAQKLAQRLHLLEGLVYRRSSPLPAFRMKLLPDPMTPP